MKILVDAMVHMPYSSYIDGQDREQSKTVEAAKAAKPGKHT
jgi:hypothetical protein